MNKKTKTKQKRPKFTDTLDLKVNDDCKRLFQIEQVLNALDYCVEAVPADYDRHCRYVFGPMGTPFDRRYLLSLNQRVREHVMKIDDNMRVSQDVFRRLIEHVGSEHDL